MVDAEPAEFNDGTWLKDTSIGFAFVLSDHEEKEALENRRVDFGLIGHNDRHLQDVEFKDAKKILFVNPSVVSIINFEDEVEEVRDALDGAGVYDNDLIFFPINNFFVTQGFVTQFRGSHWSLLVFDRLSMTFSHYDSGNQSNYKVASQFAEKISPHIVKIKATNKTLSSDNKEEKSVEEKTSEKVKTDNENNTKAESKVKITGALTPQQANAYDCGMYVIEVARRLAQIFVESGSIGEHQFVQRSKSDGDKRKWISPEHITSERKAWKKKVASQKSL
ncbi:sentrin/sumo-specific protease, senp8 [Reticulomyxa filosa]|uniref:Sentrin/sumo-specific protease, senp8 n=1 Tax=Reticulomyxa filosa TaxID=46433 RepID=X6MFZ9_RETFI|nr:sentrin/sumo-specific protease, senp8 [Reticulomyxa filosa]|eukprot:ETO12819.1 sentrin/sumo-specific protease, senp8 [Reticulomyxa filosa]